MNKIPELVLDGGAPIARQIEGQIRLFILTGVLHPGEELPTVRAVAVGLGVNPHAVEQAYDRLERAGLLTRGEGSGPRVAAPPRGPGQADLKQLCEAFLREASERGHWCAAVLRTLLAHLEEESRHEQAH
jgi:DNA-binding transcriptional regulator YhcF (GntR family)